MTNPRWYEKKKYSQILSEWHPENKKQFQEAKTTDKDVYLWRCSSGHSFKEKLQYRLHGGKSCPVCTGSIVLAEEGMSITDFHKNFSGYKSKSGFVADELCVTHIAELFCPKGHRFIFWGHSPEENPSLECTRCYVAREVGRIISAYSTGDAFPSPFEYSSSADEKKMRRFLEEEGLRLAKAGTAIKLSENFYNWPFAVPDIVIPDCKIVVEYDSYWHHAFSEDKDKLKGDLIAKAGWKVIRIRQGQLKKINAQDVLSASGPTKKAAREVASLCKRAPQGK